MNNSIILFFALFLLGMGEVNGQGLIYDDEAPTIVVGKPMPTFQLIDRTNGRNQVINNETCKGKFVILDLWNQYCSGCIAGFKKMDDLQKTYGERLKIILVGNNSVHWKSQHIDKQYLVYKKRWNLDHVTSVYDSLLFSKHNIRFVPKWIWIDDKGIVRAYTSSGNADKIPDFLAGKLKVADVRNSTYGITMGEKSYKVFYDRTKPFMVDTCRTGNGNGHYDSNNFGLRSIISEYKEGMVGRPGDRLYNLDSLISKTSYRYEALGTRIDYLYYTALTGAELHCFIESLSQDLYYPEIQFEMKEDSLFFEKNSKKQYSYSIIVRDSIHLPSSVMMRKYMLQDLERYFGYTSYEKWEMRPTWDLKITDPIKAKKMLKTKGGKLNEFSTNSTSQTLRNANMDILFSILKSRVCFGPKHTLLNCYDQTGAGDLHFDMDLNLLYYEDLAHANKELSRYGLSIELQNRRQRVVYIKKI